MAILRRHALATALVVCTLVPARQLAAGEVPVGGFLPLVGFGLTDEFLDDLTFFSEPSTAPAPGAIWLGNGGPHYDVALLDTGASVSLITDQAFQDFNIAGPYPGEPDGFSGGEQITIVGATGDLIAQIDDPLGLYVGGLQDRTGTSPLTLPASAMEGQTNYSMISVPATSDLPNVIGIPFASQYASYIRNDMPQIFELGGRTVRTPHIEFLPLGSGGQGITREAPLTLKPSTGFLFPPAWSLNPNFDLDNPHENPAGPTSLLGGGGLFLSVDVMNDGEELNNFEFFFDTGADVSVVSRLNAVRLGFDPILDVPDFTVAVLGSGGLLLDVPGFFVEEFTIQAIGGSITANNVPVIVLDVTDPSDPGNVVDGIVGTNLLSGRNLVIDPVPALGGPSPVLYVSDPVTTEHNWDTTLSAGDWTAAGNWDAPGVPGSLGIANVRHVTGGDQTATIAADTQVWEVNVSGDGGNQMTLRIEGNATLTTFSGVNLEGGGVLSLDNGHIDTQLLENRGGRLEGSGTIVTGSGPIDGQVENRIGTVAPGDGVGTLNITGRFANGPEGTLEFEIGGTTAGTLHDQLIVDGNVALDGKLTAELVAAVPGAPFVPNVGNAFTIITTTGSQPGELGGEFAQIQTPVGAVWDIQYTSSSAILRVLSTVAGDFNGDGTVNSADYVVWRDTLGATNRPPADADGNGIIDQGDYTIWRNNFGATADAATANSIPEPSAWLLCLIAVPSSFRFKR